MQAIQIAKRYDAFRASIPCVGPRDMLVLTAGVRALGPEGVGEVLEMVQNFDDFNEDNDPWHEHDFGAFDYKGQRYFFKIEDHTETADGYRLVLTIMLASEY